MKQEFIGWTGKDNLSHINPDGFVEALGAFTIKEPSDTWVKNKTKIKITIEEI